ncbi:hypothetical protein EV182_002605 [Spiromyces aspiralis]|uniref:Uncharacterized protein n=1 Tax=Spiromyces aspiralis TaxID=68401 RepID=A0ACC1HRU7_9FUNG|nr:hypothetical protein EV182_002605 [Spiromyces aspiralis]
MVTLDPTTRTTVMREQPKYVTQRPAKPSGSHLPAVRAPSAQGFVNHNPPYMDQHDFFRPGSSLAFVVGSPEIGTPPTSAAQPTTVGFSHAKHQPDLLNKYPRFAPGPTPSVLPLFLPGGGAEVGRRSHGGRGHYRYLWQDFPFAVHSDLEFDSDDNLQSIIGIAIFRETR